MQSVELPAWVSDANADVLLVAVGKDDDSRQLLLVNASSLEAYAIAPFDPIQAYFWAPDGKKIGVLTPDGQMALVDLSTGGIERFPANERTLRYAQADGQAAFLSSTTPPETVLYPASWQLQQRLSYDGRYTFEQEYGVGIHMVNLDTGEKTLMASEADGAYVYAAGWSPVAPYLAIAQSDTPALNLFWFEKMPAITLKIYDTQGNLLNRYSGVTFPNWAPDGTMFLYQPVNEASHLFWNSPPCVYNVLTDETRCYNDVLIRHDATFYASLAWVGDQAKISYIYFDILPEPSNEVGGLCFIALSDGSEQCVLEEAASPDLVVTDYHLSPSGNAAAVILGHGGPIGDEISADQFAVVNVSTGKYVTIDGVNCFHSGFDTLGVWRPNLFP